MFPKNKFRGSDRVIIVGSGPSAANFVAPRGVPIIAVNGAIDWLNRASYFFTLDPSPDNMRRVGRGRRRRGVCYPDNEYQFGKEVPLFNVVWARERISDSMDDIGGEISGADRFIFGHTPVKSPKTFWNQQYIDTGAVFCGNLTLMKVKGDGAA